MTTGDDVMRERNARVQARYDALMLEGKHGHYETMFRVVREEVERASKVTVDEPAVERATTEMLAHAVCSEGTWEENKRLMRIGVRAALEAAYSEYGPGNSVVERHGASGLSTAPSIHAESVGAIPTRGQPTSEWNDAIEAAAKECDASAAHLDERSAAWDAVKYLAQAIRALSKKD